jgi:hypothetical protein
MTFDGTASSAIVILGKGEREKSNISRAIAVGNQTRKNPARGQNWNAKSRQRGIWIA